MSTPFTIYDPATGAIKRSGHCPKGQLGHQVRAGESILVGQALCDIQHFIEPDEVGRKIVRRHPAAVIAERAQSHPQILRLAVAEELIKKGINPALAARYAAWMQARSGALHGGSTDAAEAPPAGA